MNFLMTLPSTHYVFLRSLPSPIVYSVFETEGARFLKKNIIGTGQSPQKYNGEGPRALTKYIIGEWQGPQTKTRRGGRVSKKHNRDGQGSTKYIIGERQAPQKIH